MTNVNFSLNVETVATSRRSGCSLTAETNQDHSIHTPPQTQPVPPGASTASYASEELLQFTANLHLCRLKCLTPESLKHNFLALVTNYMLLMLLFRNLVNAKNTYIFNCRKLFCFTNALDQPVPTAGTTVIILQDLLKKMILQCGVILYIIQKLVTCKSSKDKPYVPSD